MAPKILPPPASWRPDLKGTVRAGEWQRAAGLNKDGSSKTWAAHGLSRKYILRDDRLRLIRLKDKSEFTPEDHRLLEKEKRRKSAEYMDHRKRHDIAAVRLKSNLQSVGYNRNRRKKKMEEAAKFISDKQLDIDTGVLSDKDAFEYILDLMDDNTSPIGKDIFDALCGMTLRTALWNGEFNGAIYALTSRGAAVGRAGSEYIRFIVNTPRNTPALTHSDGKRFKYSEREFKNLQATYVLLRACNSYANCTTMESAFQLLFDFLEIGRHRLWLRSGTGYSKLALRKCDIKYIEETGDKNPKFMCGITIIKNVSVLERNTDSNDKKVVAYITCGLGTKCKVNQPLSPTPFCNESQREALVTAQKTLGPNFMDGSLKRKSDAIEE